MRDIVSRLKSENYRADQLIVKRRAQGETEKEYHEDDTNYRVLFELKEKPEVKQEPKKIGGVGVIVVKDGKILCGERKSNTGYGDICGPGGHVENGESQEEAAWRETVEEFGIEPNDMIPIGFGKKEEDTGYQPKIFLCTSFNGEPECLDKEIANPRWLSLEELKEKRTLFAPFKNSLDLLQEILGEVNNTVDNNREGDIIRLEREDEDFEEEKHPRDKNGRFVSKGERGEDKGEKSSKVGEVKTGKKGNLKPKNEGARRISTHDALEESKGGFKNSLSDHLDENGNLSEERQKVHDEIIREFFKEKVSYKGKPTMVMSGGGPASGKTFVRKDAESQFGIDTTITVDPDDFKKMLPGYEEMAKKDEGAAGFYHEESSALAKRAYQFAVDNNINVVYDGTGDGSVGSVLKKLKMAQDAGYAVKGSYVTVDIDEALKRNEARYQNAKKKYEAGESDVPPRKPREKVVEETHRKVSDISAEVANKFDEFELWDNNVPRGEKPIKIATCQKDGKIVATPGNEERLQRYLDKGNKKYKVVNGQVELG